MAELEEQVSTLLSEMNTDENLPGTRSRLALAFGDTDLLDAVDYLGIQFIER